MIRAVHVSEILRKYLAGRIGSLRENFKLPELSKEKQKWLEHTPEDTKLFNQKAPFAHSHSTVSVLSLIYLPLQRPVRSDTSRPSCSPPSLLIVHQIRWPLVLAQPSLHGDVPLLVRNSAPPSSPVQTWGGLVLPVQPVWAFFPCFIIFSCIPVSHMPYNLLFIMFIVCSLPAFPSHTSQDDRVLVRSSSHVFSTAPGPADTQPRFEG